MIGINKRNKSARSCKSDDFYTPEWAVEFIVPYLQAAGLKHVWECCSGLGHIVSVLERSGFEVTGTDIRNGLEYDFRHCLVPDGVDCIVTNPPFSLAMDAMMRGVESGLAFAFLMPLYKMETKIRQDFMRTHNIGILPMGKRTHFLREEGATTMVGFESMWFVRGIPHDGLVWSTVIDDSLRTNTI